MSVKISIAYHSGFGHTERQARAVASGAESAGAYVTLHDITTLDDALWSTLADADAIIFGSPTYMGTASAAFQTFAEASGAVWAEAGWRDKLAAGFTNSAGLNGDKLNTLETMSLLAAQHGMTWVSLALPPGGQYTTTGSEDDLNRLAGFLGAMAQSPSDADAANAPRDSDLRTAAHLGARVAKVAMQLERGRAVLAGA